MSDEIQKVDKPKQAEPMWMVHTRFNPNSRSHPVEPELHPSSDASSPPGCFLQSRGILLNYGTKCCLQSCGTLLNYGMEL